MAVFALSACIKVQVIKHNPHKAVEDASATLELLYFEGNSDAAWATCDEAFRSVTTAQDMASGANQMVAALGPMNELRAEAYQPIQGQKAMTLFYEGRHERGSSYHRVVVTGDSGGYRIFSIESGSTPFTELGLSDVYRFDEAIVSMR
jgi:hypothetical protein